MSHFIKLSQYVINKLHISHIIQQPNKYYLYMNISNINGLFIFSFGSVSTSITTVEICEKNNKQDYDIITNFIKEIK
jgi:hypothetical protein